MRIMMKSAKVALMAALTVLAVSCKDTDVYDPDAPLPGGEETSEKVANTFDFSTIQNVNLSVDYSAFKLYGPVQFSVYNQNPFVGEDEFEQLDSSIIPIFSDFTDADGKFSKSVKLPAYAQHLYVVTGNFFVSDYLIEADVKNGAAKAVATKPAAARNSSVYVTRAEETYTDDVATIPSLSSLVDVQGNVIPTGQKYKIWKSYLGKWSETSGRPQYINNTTNPKLVFSGEDFASLCETVSDALNSNAPCHEEYRAQPDLTLQEESEVSITVIGGSTCWNSSLGYYYYTEDTKPTKPEDLNIVMLFPNTQCGGWKKMKSNYDYQNSVALHAGDVVQLMYYPNIANNSMDNATTKFPKGTKIGFILKTHAWGMKGNAYQIKGYNSSKAFFNMWGTSTDGASYTEGLRCPPFDKDKEYNDNYKYLNTDGESRIAKFAYVKNDNEKYAIVSFEDACSDQDYDDLVFALKPNVFTPIPEIVPQKTSTFSVYGYEDLWPKKGDYDLNDVIVESEHEKISIKKSPDKVFKLVQESFKLTTYQNYVELKSGLALTLHTPVQPSSVVTKIKHKKTGIEEEVSFKVENNGTDNVYYLTSDVTANLGDTYIIQLNYSVGQTSSDLASIDPFIYREEDGNQTWQVHIPFEAPAPRMKFGYFHTEDDLSVPDRNIFFVRDTDYPFAFHLFGTKIDNFELLLKPENESVPVSTLFPLFLDWAKSKGTQHADWYLFPRESN